MIYNKWDKVSSSSRVIIANTKIIIPTTIPLIKDLNQTQLPKTKPTSA